MEIIIFIAIIIILLIIYNYATYKVPDSLKDIHSISFFSIAISQLMKREGGNAKIYSRCKEYFERDGVIKLYFRGKWICMITDLVVAKELCLRNDIFPKLMLDEILPNSAAERHFGVNVVHSNGDVWKRHRRVCNPAFKTLPIHLFVEKALKLMDILEKVDNKPIEVRDFMQRLTLDVLGKVAFNFDFNNLEDPKNPYVTAYNEVQNVFRNPLISILQLDRIPIINQLVFRKIDKLNNLFEDIIKEKRKSLAAGHSNGDLLELMLKACEDPDNQMLSDTELRCNLAIFMVAGHDTTAMALSSLLYLLAIHKDVQEKAREEVLRILGDNLTPSSEQHAELKYLNMVIRENLRLYPPAGGLTLRVLTEDLKLKNFLIPAGTPVSLFIYGIQHSPKFWKNPEEFLPERCLGNNFSLIEQRIVLCLLLRKYEIALPQNSIHKNELKFKNAMTPHPIDLIFKRRCE
ncbi:cytochrome P450 [Gigaspora rosea]|uniref:Cytochrome P450 n=1 Tax=Gigaspora rosea TaxID=44941 RepID=A0A397VNY3_9GLOM|nr:cytochrome P450 [Gigaspora rosea]